MKTVKLEMLPRLILENILGAQRGTVEDMEIPAEVRKRIKVSQDVRDTLFVEVRGKVLVDEEAIAAAPALEVDLEKEEVKRLVKILKEWPNASPDDRPHIVELIDTLEG